MLHTGIIKEVHNGKASVEIQHSSACGESCASCGLCHAKTSLVDAVNAVNAAVGDTVLIDMSDKKVLGAAFLVYIVPLIMLIAGYFIGAVKSEKAGIITGFSMMIITFLIIIIIDKKIKRSYMPNIIRIVTE